MHKFKIPLKPVSFNQAYRRARKGMIISEKGMKFKEDCSDFLREQYTEERPLKGKLRVRILYQLGRFLTGRFSRFCKC